MLWYGVFYDWRDIGDYFLICFILSMHLSMAYASAIWSSVYNHEHLIWSNKVGRFGFCIWESNFDQSVQSMIWKLIYLFCGLPMANSQIGSQMWIQDGQDQVIWLAWKLLYQICILVKRRYEGGLYFGGGAARW